MKNLKIIIVSLSLLLLSNLNAIAQLGIIAGYGASAAYGGGDEFGNIQQSDKEFISACFGLEYEYILSRKFSVSTGTILKGKGFSYTNPYKSYNNANNKVYISVPLTIDYKINLSSHERFIIGAGGFYDYSWNLEQFEKPHQFGSTAKVGFEIKNLELGFMYDLGLTPNSEMDEKTKAYYFTIGYRFGGAYNYLKSELSKSNY